MTYPQQPSRIADILAPSARDDARRGHPSLPSSHPAACKCGIFFGTWSFSDVLFLSSAEVQYVFIFLLFHAPHMGPPPPPFAQKIEPPAKRVVEYSLARGPSVMLYFSAVQKLNTCSFFFCFMLRTLERLQHHSHKKFNPRRTELWNTPGTSWPFNPSAKS
jgi:hypothetical protein